MKFNFVDQIFVDLIQYKNWFRLNFDHIAVNCTKIYTIGTDIVQKSRLEYCSTVWSPIYAKYNDIIEKVQRKYTRMYFFKFNLTRIDYDDRLTHLKIHSLKSRRLENDEITLYKIIHNRIDTSLNQHLSYYNHGRVSRRDQPTFYTPFGSSNIVRNEPLHRMQNHHDKYFHDINIFDDSFYSFKKLVKEKFDF